MAEAFGQATSFLVEEISGSPNQRTRLTLAGRALPYRPYTLSGSMRAEFTWYPGNPEATVQVLGAEEKPTTVNGMWKDRFIRESVGQQFTAVAELNNQQVDSADALVKAVDTIRRRGQLLRVSWGTQIRVGILTDFVAKYDRLEDVEWEMTFGWISQGDAQGQAVTTGQNDLGRTKSSWDRQADILSDSLLSPPFDIGSLEAAIESQAASINDRINEVTDAVALVTQAANAPAVVAQRLNGIYESIKDTCSEMIGTLTSVPPVEVFVLAANDIQDGEPTFSALLLADQWVSGVLQATRSAQRFAAEQQDEIASLISSNLVAVIVARQGDDLRGVSTKFYGTPDGWRRLMRYNELTQSELSAGQVVLVPRLESGDV